MLKDVTPPAFFYVLQDGAVDDGFTPFVLWVNVISRRGFLYATTEAGIPPKLGDPAYVTECLIS